MSCRVLITICCLLVLNSQQGHSTRPYKYQYGRRDDFGISSSYQEQRCGGRNGYRCLATMSTCRRGKCVCSNPPYFWGDGVLACYGRGTVAAEIKNDPIVTSFGGESAQFPFPCRYLVTHFTSDLKVHPRRVIGKCEVEIHAFNARKKGKIFVNGFDISILIKYDDGRQRRLSSRNYGILKGNMAKVYSERSWPTSGSGYVPEGYWDRDNGVRVSHSGIKWNRQFVISAYSCGVTVRFVPYDVLNYRSSARIPGLSVSIKPGFNTQWHSGTKVMALPPLSGGGPPLRNIKKPGLNLPESMVYRAFSSGVEQTQPWGGGAQCVAAGKALDKCDTWTRKMALRSCFWMFEEARFMKCYDNQFDSIRLLGLFEKCINMWCGDVECSDVQAMISASGCHNVRRIRRLTMFMDGDLCARPYSYYRP